MYQVNLNEYVKVKLTDHGISILKKERAELNKRFAERGLTGFGEYEPKVDEDGYTSFQLWDLMQRLGPHISIGCQLPFETNVILNSERSAG
ncbi:hypothetical protein ABER23_07905 [Paenibacillus lautus]|uniref:hypothetical protein n=1 Tax=Paenibacillus lautus TaxID=1401 RepID=UPI003D26F55F